MTIGQFYRDFGVRIAVSAATGAFTIVMFNPVKQWFTSLASTDDITFAVQMVGEEIHAEIAPLVKQTRENTAAICTGRKATLKAAIRDLRVEIAEMDKLQYLSGWTDRDGRLLAEWTADYEDGVEELANLRC